MSSSDAALVPSTGESHTISEKQKKTYDYSYITTSARLAQARLEDGRGDARRWGLDLDAGGGRARKEFAASYGTTFSEIESALYNTPQPPLVLLPPPVRLKSRFRHSMISEDHESGRGALKGKVHRPCTAP